MAAEDRLSAEFERQRPRLRGLAYRMLDSTGDAEDAVGGGVAAAVPGGGAG